MKRGGKKPVKDEYVEIIDDGGAIPDRPAGGVPAWRVLIVDDEREVHAATLFALKDLIVSGRPLEFLHAYSAAEARGVMERTPGVAVVLLDVVMETGDAGLQLVRVIRDELGCADTRIILRTGQPGYAPELEVIRRSAPTNRSAWCSTASAAWTASCASHRPCWRRGTLPISPRRRSA